MKKEKKDYSIFYIIGIVAVVAVLAMVVSFGGKATHVETSSYNENAAGLAVKSLAMEDVRAVTDFTDEVNFYDDANYYSDLIMREGTQIKILSGAGGIRFYDAGSPGAGEAYACFTGNGEIFRSSTPCVEESSSTTAVLPELDCKVVRHQLTVTNDDNLDTGIEQCGVDYACVGSFYATKSTNAGRGNTITTPCNIEYYSNAFPHYYKESLCCKIV